MIGGFDVLQREGSRSANVRTLAGYLVPAEIRTPNQQIMRRVGGHRQGQTKQDAAVFTESAAVKVRYIFTIEVRFA
jgi:hypothetical protein